MKKIWRMLKDVWLGLFLIAITSSLLLVSDLERRGGGATRQRQKIPRLAIMQWAATDLLDTTVQGIVEGLRRQGFVDPSTATIRFYNALGDTATGNMMAKELVAGGYDMVLTASTTALQVVAAANRAGRVIHLFAAVTDPYGAGVGISGPLAADRPAHLLGLGTFQPVDGLFRLARQMNPSVKRVGVVWNPAEDNSLACLRKARAVCRELGIELLEANAGNTSEVPEALRSLLSRQAQAVWIGGDTVAIAAINGILSAAKAAGVPVFTNDPGDSKRGALFALGATYETVGMELGELSGRILHGESTAQLGVANRVPELFTVNEKLLNSYPGWSLGDELRQRARTPAPGRAQSLAPGKKPSGPYRVRIVRYNDAQFSLDTQRGIMDGFRQAGWTEGKEFELRMLCAQGDMSTLSSIVTAVIADDPDLIMPISTPALQAVLRQAGSFSVVFSSVADGVRAGAGESETRHMPNVTGITTCSSFAQMAQLIRETYPRARKVGTLFTPAEINSELYRKWFAEALTKVGLELIAVPVTASAETAEATGVLLRSGIELIAQITDNATRPGFAQMVKRATDEKVAFFCFDSSGMKDGATLALSRDYYQTGREAAQVAKRILQGESPAGIPFVNTRTELLVINLERLTRLEVRLPPRYRDQATQFRE